MPQLMSLIKKYSNYYILILVLSLFSCNNEDITKITAIELETEFLELLVGSEFVFEVTSDTSQDITNLSTYKVDGVAIISNSFITFEAGTFNVQSFYNDIESNTLSIRVVNPSDYSQKVLIEDYTGTWCGFCPRVIYAIEQAKIQSDKIVSVAIHIRNSDPYIFDGSTALSDEFQIGGLPEGRLNRTIFWENPQQNNVQQAVDLTGFNAPLGLAIQSELVDDLLDINISVGFSETYVANIGVVLYLVENGLIYNQTNYTDLFPVGQYVDPLVNFEHKDVLRAIYTNNLGDVIPTIETVENNIFTINFQETIPASIENTANLHLVAFVVNKDTNEVINVQEAVVGEDKLFD